MVGRGRSPGLLVEKSSRVERLRLFEGSPGVQRRVVGLGGSCVWASGGLEKWREVSITIVERWIVGTSVALLLRRRSHEGILLMRVGIFVFGGVPATVT